MGDRVVDVESIRRIRRTLRRASLCLLSPRSLRPPLRYRSHLPLLFLGAGIVVAGTVAAGPVAAQEADALRREAERTVGRPLSDAEILRFLTTSGLTPEEVRLRLSRRGYDPGAADPYLALLEGSADAIPDGTDPLPLLAVLVEGDGARDTGTRRGAVAPQRPAILPTAESDGPPIFGRDLFARSTSQFVPMSGGPAPPDYRLGPGDELVLVLTGDVEQAYRLTVSPEGWIVLPDVGRVFVNGLSLADLDEAMYHRLASVYSGIRREGGSTFFDVSLGDVRTQQVYVIGEVEQPAAYNVSSLASALTALYWAGGPAPNGSYRSIAINRGGERIATVDLYEYLLRGAADQDVRLEHGDVVFVPPVERRVTIDGAVMRPGRYEATGSETLADVLTFAGGVLPEADLRRVQIRRILPTDERRPGIDRTVVDVSLSRVDDGAEVPMQDGDEITVFAVLDDAGNEVTISGGVWRPGTYAAGTDTRLWDLIGRAGGLLPDALESRAQIQRLEADHTRRLIPVSLAVGTDGVPIDNPELLGLDQVFVFAQRNLREDRIVSIGGWVQDPGVYPFSAGMTVRDLVLKAGGVRTGAYLDNAEVSRVVISQSRSDTLTQRFQVPLDSGYVFLRPETSDLDGAESGALAAGPPPEFELHNLDAVYVRKSPGFEPQQNVLVSGEVMLPGPYSLQTRGQRITDLIDQAGGLTPEAYAEGLQLWRAQPDSDSDTLTAAEIAGRSFGEELSEDELQRLADAGEIRERLRPNRTPLRRVRVGVDFVSAMQEPVGPNNVLVAPNDSIYVPTYIPTVQVKGAVGVETRVLYRGGAGLGFYIDQAGGYAKQADKSRARVRYANGEVRTRGSKFLFFGGNVPDPDPGSEITVPLKPEETGEGMRMTEWVGIVTSLVMATATLLIATSK